MASEDPAQPERQPPDRVIDRRTLLKSGLLAGGALLGGGVALGDVFSGGGRAPGSMDAAGTGAAAARHAAQAGASAGGAAAEHSGSGARSTARGSGSRTQPGPYRRRPNILFIMVDQLRTPVWFSAGALAAAMMPNLQKLRDGAVSFESHYTASNDCSPARSALVTGLYTHQTGCMITGGSTLDHGFPTWGSMLREHGYKTWWYGKWHLTHGDNLWSLPADAGALERYGFSGGTYPSPDGGPGQGWRVDPHIAGQFEEWLARAPSKHPWCTTVSFVNPHDIAWWYRWSDRYHGEANAGRVVHSLPPNFETPEQMIARRKPRLQRSHQQTASDSFGHVPFSGPLRDEAWLPFLDLYMKLQHRVDEQIGRVMRALHSRPEMAANTVVLFTSDHGEFGASHGMRGKGAAVYEEALRVPLLVKDLRGGEELVKSPSVPRKGLTSSVDVAPLLLSIATESDSWRKDSHHAQIARRHSLLKMLRNPHAPGRPYVLHATDEIVTEFAVKLYAADAPLHVTAIRTPTAKLALYSNWAHESIDAVRHGRESELYDYRRQAGRLELENIAGHGRPLEAQLRAKLLREAHGEMREQLPRRLHEAHRRGFADYFETAAKAAVKATERRARMLEKLMEGRKLGSGLHRMLEREYGARYLSAHRRAGGGPRVKRRKKAGGGLPAGHGRGRGVRRG